MENTRKMRNASAEKKNANVSKRNERNEKKTAKSETEKQAAREARLFARIERICEKARKAGAWREAKGLINKAGAQEKDLTLGAAAAIYTRTDTDGRGEARLRKAVYDLASSDLRAVLKAVPADLLAHTVTYTGAIQVSTLGRMMAAEIAKNPKTALAVAQAAQDATRKAARKARKEAKKAAQGKAGAK